MGFESAEGPFLCLQKTSLELSVDRCTRDGVIGLAFAPSPLGLRMDFGARDPVDGQIAGTPFPLQWMNVLLYGESSSA